MEKMFVHIAKKASFTTALQTKYTNSIVFIKDTLEIWTHGTFYAIPDTYKDKITDLQSAVTALQAIYAFTTISDGTNTAVATATAKTIKFTGEGATTVTVGADGVNINTPIDTLVTGTTNGTVKFNGTDVAVKGLNDAAYLTKKYFDDAIADAKKAGTDAATAAASAQSTANAKVASVTATAGTAIAVAGTTTAPTVGLKLAATQGNVTLSLSADGLKATTSFPVTGVKAADKVLSMTGTTVGSTLNLTYDSTAKLIKLTGIDDAVIASIDATEFIKDGMVDNVTFNDANKKLTITFNTASGKEAIDVDLSSLIDTYTGANLKLTAASGFTANTVLDTAINQLKTDVANAAVSGVTSFGGKTGAVTVKGSQTANGTVNLEMADNELLASIVGLGSAAYTPTTNYATAAQGIKADSAVLNVRATNAGTYVSVAAAKDGTTINLTPSVTVQAVASASTSVKGLAEASDVKTYADSLFAWEEF